MPINHLFNRENIKRFDIWSWEYYTVESDVFIRHFFHSDLIITMQKELLSCILKEHETHGPTHSVHPLGSYSLTQTVPRSITERYQTTKENTAQA